MLPSLATVQFLPDSDTEASRPSNCHFREGVQMADLGSHPHSGLLLFDPDYRGLAADPTFLAGGQL